MNRPPWTFGWFWLILVPVLIWAGVVVALYMAAGCSVDAPC